MDAVDALRARPYPGGGILVGRTGDNALVACYWLSGRSPASRERVLRSSGNDLEAVGRGDTAFDPLLHYRAATSVAQFGVVGNGDHVDALAGAIWDDASLGDALDQLAPEPDPPIRTPRLAAVIDETDGSCTLVAARSAPANQVDRLLVRATPQRGWGLLVTTYRGAVNDPRTDAIAIWVELASDLATQIEACWGAIDTELRAAIAGRCFGSDDPWTTRAES